MYKSLECYKIDSEQIISLITDNCKLNIDITKIWNAENLFFIKMPEKIVFNEKLDNIFIKNQCRKYNLCGKILDSPIKSFSFTNTVELDHFRIYVLEKIINSNKKTVNSSKPDNINTSKIKPEPLKVNISAKSRITDHAKKLPKQPISKPGLSKPVLSKPVLSKPVQSKPVQSKPVLSKTGLTKSVLSKPGLSKPGLSKPSLSKPLTSGNILVNKIRRHTSVCPPKCTVNQTEIECKEILKQFINNNCCPETADEIKELLELKAPELSDFELPDIEIPSLDKEILDLTSMIAYVKENFLNMKNNNTYYINIINKLIIKYSNIKKENIILKEKLYSAQTKVLETATEIENCKEILRCF